MNEINAHKPVLVQETLKYLITDINGIYVDCTVGLGGHALRIMECLGSEGRLIAIDRDAESLAVAKINLAAYSNRTVFVHAPYSQLGRILREQNIEHVHGVLLDLGFSSYQIDNPQRGFSFRDDGPLDMRYDRTAGKTLAEYVNTVNYEELSDVIYTYGEERFSRKIAKAIVNFRKKKPIATTKEVAQIIKTAVGRKYAHDGIDCATRTFQALRIVINDELKHLECAMEEIAESLITKGRLAIISFHSLEDRRAKEFIYNNSRGCTCTPHFPKCVCGFKKRLRVITPKVVRPTAEESAENPRARSARLRVAERV